MLLDHHQTDADSVGIRRAFLEDVLTRLHASGPYFGRGTDIREVEAMLAAENTARPRQRRMGVDDSEIE
jgi:hypothetical protein